MTDFLRQERTRAFVRAIEHLRAALTHLRAVYNENEVHGLGLELPPQKPLTDAMNQCAHIYKQPGETHI